MPTEMEISAAYSILPLVRVKKILEDDNRQWTGEELFNWLSYVVSFDQSDDWTYLLIAQGVCPFCSDFSSYSQANEKLIEWLSQDTYIDIGVDNTLIAALLFWIEGKELEYESSSTWDGVVGQHYVTWSEEERGRVCRAYAAGDEVIFQL